MKAFILFFTLSFTALAQNEMPEASPLDYQRLSQRFVTSVKEAEVEEKYLQVDQVKKCLSDNKITKEMLSDPVKVKEQQDKASKCVKDEFAKIDPSKIDELSKTLGLEAFGVVKGKGSAEVIDYFASRLEKALYGVDSKNQPYKLKDQKIVDQKVFVDLYETQVGKNILLEISNYCLNSFSPGASSDERDRFSKISKIAIDDLSKIPSYSDELVDGARIKKDDTEIYKEFMNNVVGDKTGGAEATKKKLEDIFGKCTAVIPLMCEYHEYCACKSRPTTDGVDCSNNKFAKINPTCDPNKGKASCHVVARLRGYRTNLMALETTKKQINELQDNKGLRRIDKFEVYNSKDAGTGNSIDDLTSLSSSDVDKIKSGDDLKKQADEFEKQDCVATPEDSKCFSQFYNEKETLNFANNAIGFNAATALESARIAKLKETELEEYLKNRGYFDLAEKAKNKEDTQKIVKEAQLRFETERDATFSEMSKAFERKQLVTGTEDAKKARMTDARNELKFKNKEFQQLLVFNNVVSSYLSLQKKDKSGKLVSAGTNIQALKREFDSAKSSNAKDKAELQYFSEASSAKNESLNGENPIVDVNFLDTVLGKTEKPTP
ncbi:MAG: hypothetical protein K2P81_15580 [Bacteriovoracaceae bacterium]|nr:hypothetical protein [Bacteriovoracaceae bacterium]